MGGDRYQKSWQALVVAVGVWAAARGAAAADAQCAARWEGGEAAVAASRVQVTAAGHTWRFDVPAFESASCTARAAVADGRVLLLVTWSADDEEVYQWAAVLGRAGAPRVVHAAPVHWSGDPGERFAELLRLTESPAALWRGVVSELATVCGQRLLPLLYPQRYDPRRGRFVAGGDTAQVAGARPLDAAREEPHPVRRLAARGVSSSAGDDGNPLLTVFPHALIDGRMDTVWEPGGDRLAGQFVTFDVAVPRMPVTGVYLAVRRARTPVRMVLHTEKARFVVTVPEGGHWFSFPKPQTTGCLTVQFVDDMPVADGPRLAEVAVGTRNDGADVTAWLTDADTADAAVALMRLAPDRYAASLVDAWPGLSDAAKRRAFRVLLDAGAKAAPALAEAAVRWESSLADAAVAALGQYPEEAARAVAPFVRTDTFDRALDVLRRVDGRGAVDVLVDALVEQGGAWSKERVRAWGRALRGTKAVRSRLDRVVDTARAHLGRSALAAPLLAVAAGFSEGRGRAGAVARHGWETAEAFADRYRFLRVLGRADKRDAVAAASAAIRDADAHLRALAVRVVEPYLDDSRARRVVLRAVCDAHPHVRATALEAVARAGGAVSVDTAVMERRLRDLWPFVRIKALRAAVASKMPGSGDWAARALEDEKAAVRYAALQAAGRAGPSDALDRAIVRIARTERRDADVRVAAVEALAARCIDTDDAVALLADLVRAGAVPGASAGQTAVASAAAAALGALGDPRGKRVLQELLQNGNDPVEAAVAAALSAPARCARAEDR